MQARYMGCLTNLNGPVFITLLEPSSFGNEEITALNTSMTNSNDNRKKPRRTQKGID